MTKDVLITVVGTIFDKSGEKDSIEITVNGKYYEKNGKLYLIYEEVGEDAKEVVRNTVIIGEKRVELTKRGSVDAQMAFEEGYKLNSAYQTMYGVMEMGIYTQHIACTREENELKLELVYRMEINHEEVSSNQLSLLAKSLPVYP